MPKNNESTRDTKHGTGSERPHSQPEDKMIQTIYGYDEKKRKLKNEKDNLREFYKPL